MEYTAWAPQYARIQKEFGFAFDREEAAARRLTDLLPIGSAEEALGEVGRRLAGRPVVVVGLAPRFGPPPIWRLPDLVGRPAVVAADGAAEVCLAGGLVPDVVVTDLDGPVASEVTANSRGALVLVHAHGDNLPAIERWVPEFSRPVFGSWAGPPTDRLVDVGGFTDGDRAVYLATHVGASRVLLWAFDFRSAEEPDPGARARKLEKLRCAEEMVAWLAVRTDVPIELWGRDGRRVPYGTTGTGPSTQ